MERERLPSLNTPIFKNNMIRFGCMVAEYNRTVGLNYVSST